MQKSSSSPIIRFLSYMKPVRFQIMLAILFGIYKFMVPVVIAWAIGEIVTVLTDDAIPSGEKMPAMTKYIGIMVIITASSPIFVYYRHVLSQVAAIRVINDLRLDLFAHVQRLSHSFFNRNQSGSIASRIISDVSICIQFVNTVMIQSWMHLSVVILIFGYFLTQSILLAILSISLIPLQIYIIKTLGNKIKTNSKKIQYKISELSGTTVETMSNITVVKTFTAEENERQRFSLLTDGLVAIRTHTGKLQAWNQVLNTVIASLAPLIVITVGGYLSLKNPEMLSVGVLVTFILMQGQIYNPIIKLADMQIILSESLGALERIYDLFDTFPEVTNHPNAVTPHPFLGRVELKDIVFGYQPGQPVIQNVSLTIKENQTVALVGPSGSGKTTLSMLIPRFYDLDSGVIKIDGRDIKEYKLRKLRRQIGIVPQEPLLFSGSVYDNISYGDPDATPEQVFEAAELANADQFIRTLYEGYDTKIGENGARLSGGQKQRLAIARAFLKNPPILILDEATSALDTESEALIQGALKRLMRNRTTIIIAHRLSTIREADKIFVFQNGKLVEEGNHTELTEFNGRYASLLKVQLP